MVQAVGWELWRHGEQSQPITIEIVPAAIRAAAARVGELIGHELLPPDTPDHAVADLSGLYEYLDVSAWPRWSADDPWGERPPL